MNLAEIGLRLRERRHAIGLSQHRLAKLAGLSRATVNQFETGTLTDLGVAKLAVLLELVGLRLDARASKPTRRGLLMASRTASVSYKSALGIGPLAKALTTGELPASLVPHVATLLDEAPLPIVVAAVEEAARRHRVPPKSIWPHLANWSKGLKVQRKVWA